MKVKKTIYTIGHSIRPIQEFLDILKSFEIDLLVDICRDPGSRKYPHFNQEALKTSLTAGGIHYQHLISLGGRRTAKKNSSNQAWKNLSFRGFADYMETEEFRIEFMNLRNGLESKRRLSCVRRPYGRVATDLWFRIISKFMAGMYGIFLQLEKRRNTLILRSPRIIWINYRIL